MSALDCITKRDNPQHATRDPVLDEFEERLRDYGSSCFYEDDAGKRTLKYKAVVESFDKARAQ